MSNDISAFGLRVQLTASETFPSGISITQFGDDADPFDTATMEILGEAMGINGDLITWSKALAAPLVINVIPGGEDDENLSVLFEANRVGKGKQGARDVVGVTAIYPDGSTVSFVQGKIKSGTAAKSAASSGRLKTRPYSFVFENVNRT